MTAPNNESDLADYLFALWSRRWLILLSTGLATGATLAASLLVAKTYRSTATLMISGSKVPSVSAADPRMESRLFGDTYAELVESRSIASRVVRELKLHERPHPLDEDRLLNRLNVRSVPNTLLLKVQLDYQDPDLAARIVNAQTEQAVALSKSIGQGDLTETRAYLQEQVKAGKEELDRRQESLRELKGRLRFEESAKQLEFLLRQRGELEGALAQAEQEMTMRQAEASSIREALKGQDRILTLTRSVVDDPVFKEAVGGGRSAREVLGVQIKAETVNPLVAETEPERVKADALAAGAAARRNQVRRQLDAVLATTRQLERELADKSSALNSALRDYDLAKAAYEQFSKSFENARLSVAAQSAELKIVDPAVPGLRPVSPKIILNVAIAVVVSFILSVFASLFFDYLSAARRGPLLVPVEPRAAADAPVGLRSTR
jgi:uncharacterized protein involved in exopolysaccharide biosynthesis